MSNLGRLKHQQPRCVVALYGTNDLRLHDHYAVALAVERAKQLNVPLVAAFCFDTRTLAQPSLLGGFFRASPQRARFLSECVEDLRVSWRAHGSELFVRSGLPEVEIPRLAAELGAAEVFATTQYAPHEEMVQRSIDESIRGLHHDRPAADAAESDDKKAGKAGLRSVWNTTLYHIDDLPTPPEALREHFRLFADEAEMMTIRSSEPFDCDDGRIRKLGPCLEGALEVAPGIRVGEIPSLDDLGYKLNRAAFHLPVSGDNFVTFEGGESRAFDRLKSWCVPENMGVYVGYGQSKQKRFIVDSVRQARLSPWISHGCLSPRMLAEQLMILDAENAGRFMVSDQVRFALHRLAKRDYYHFLGVKFGRRLFFPFGPRPEDTGDIADPRIDRAIVQKWCSGLTGFPFVDAGMKQLTATGWAADHTRQSLAWFLSRGFGQDWRLGAEWFERCSLDYDPFVCYGQFAYFSGLLKDRLGDKVHGGHYIAHRADGLGIFVRKWLPHLTRVPEAYMHRPHVMSAKMQEMYQCRIGHHYPFPLKLWRGAQRELDELPAYFSGMNGAMQPGLFEAARFNPEVLSKAEAHPCVTAEGVATAEAAAPKDPVRELVPVAASRQREPEVRQLSAAV